jgi:pyruvyl transferase EpsO
MSALRAALVAAVDGLRGRRVALLDFPQYSNVGDSMIWLGARAVLRDVGARVVYACHQRSYSRERLARRLGDGCICLTGGGNLGDLWPHHQAFRERVLDDFPHHDIVQLPQTVSFVDPAGIARVGAAFRRHARLTVMVRDRASLALVGTEMGVPAVLVPDLAFGLDALPPRPRADVDVLGLCRVDAESSGALAGLARRGVPVADWLDDEPSRARAAVERLDLLAVRHPRMLGWGSAVAARLYDRVARERVTRGFRLIGRARVVIVDRLHGHILCLLAGIPHVVVDTRFGKVRGFQDAWTADSPLARSADSLEAALDMAAELLRTSLPLPMHGERAG